ncbi:MAG TPA: phosphoribosylformylglycinamidine synthase subunit PurL [Euryarchaeota archaeon]|nr:phosphoribosylformylglycinamidine synthase subunit PurL [Euryarchaeota archaeon]
MSQPLLKRIDAPFEIFQIDLFSATDDQLESLSHELGIALSLDEMKRIREHFEGKGRLPTDVELQSIGQAWSEHCCYKSSKVFLKEFITGIDNRDVLLRGDAGVMRFDDKHAYALRIESHNHPSAVEPYGGAATGIGGIIRDVLCMGAQPIALIDPLFFGPLEIKHENIPVGIKHPKYLFSGVVAGIRDYGNRVGIPTVSGGVWFDDGYVGNCLVNVGCVGIAKIEELKKNSVGGADETLILVGGRTGRDGIHGVTFASAVLTEKSDEESRGAVQLGDPIMKEPLIHAVLEANRDGLISGMKDLGGGGLSCVVGEIALSGGCGAIVDLDKVPLKESGLAPWEIWVSESQERMMLSVKEDDADKVLEIFSLYDVPATKVGHTIQERTVTLIFNGVKVFEMDLEFLTSGPEYCRPCNIDSVSSDIEEAYPEELERYDVEILDMLSSINVCSREWVIRQYDHEVRGGTVIKPLQGLPGHSTHGDAAVLKPVEDSAKGLALSVSSNPYAVAIDPYRGSMMIIDEVCRNLASVGARPHSLTDCLNFGNPEKPEVLGMFREAVRGIGEAAAHLDLPIPSGNVSFYNEAPTGTVLPTPVVLGCGIVEDICRCITSDLKREGSDIYLIGRTQDAMAGTQYFMRNNGRSAKVPEVDLEVLSQSINFLIDNIEKDKILSCHDISEGGIATALCEMAVGGSMGAEIDLSTFDIGLRSDVKLFSESPTRWLVEVEHGTKLEPPAGVELTKIGSVGESSVMIYDGEEILFEQTVAEIECRWSMKLWEIMG